MSQDRAEEILQQQKARMRKQKRRKKQMIAILMRLLVVSAIFLVVLLLVVAIIGVIRKNRESKDIFLREDKILTKRVEERPELDVQLLEPNPYSRPQIVLEEVNGIVIHYTGNPGTTAQQNHDYFNNLATTHETSASSHFIIGLDGEIIQNIPCDEIAYCSNERNSDTISIECCIPDDTGHFNDATYDSLVELVAWLMGRYDLTSEEVIRHYDVTGKVCPKYFVEHEGAWLIFKQDLLDYIEKNGK